MQQKFSGIATKIEVPEGGAISEQTVKEGLFFKNSFNEAATSIKVPERVEISPDTIKIDIKSVKTAPKCELDISDVLESIRADKIKMVKD